MVKYFNNRASKIFFLLKRLKMTFIYAYSDFTIPSTSPMWRIIFSNDGYLNEQI